MRARVLEQLTESARALRAAAANPDLRRLELALVALVVGQWSFTVVVAVYAYHQGGPAAVGLVGLIRMLPSAFAAPLTALLADRFRRQRVLLVAALAEGTGVAVTAAAVLGDAPALLVYALTAVVQVATTAAVPARAALIPSLARSPAELTAANVAATTIDSVGAFAGPAVAGVLLGAADVGPVLVLVTAAFGLAVVLLARIRPDEAPRPTAAAERLPAALVAGARAILTEPALAVLTGLYAAQTFVAGALNVLLVVASLELLGLGDAGVGYLNAAIGVGGLAGAAAMLALVRTRRLARHFALGLVLWGVPMALVAAWPQPAFALAVLGLLGVGNTFVDVAGVTLLQRAVPNVVLARVFGVLESLTWGTIALGSIAAAGLVGAFGIRPAFVAVGALLPLLTVLLWRGLARLDERPPAAEETLELLRGVPIFAPLPLPVLEGLASGVEDVRFPAGAVVFERGDPGDRFYVVASGEALAEPAGEEPVRLGPGDFFGEIALLSDVPRTATVRARTAVRAHALAGEAFVAAVTGYAESAEAAELVIGARLRPNRARGASV